MKKDTKQQHNTHETKTSNRKTPQSSIQTHQSTQQHQAQTHTKITIKQTDMKKDTKQQHKHTKQKLQKKNTTIKQTDTPYHTATT